MRLVIGNAAAVAVFCAFQFHSLLADEEVDTIERQLIERLEAAKATGYREKPEPGDLASVNSTVRIGGKGEAWAIMQFYLWGQSGRLRLRWWESEDSLNRLLMLILRLNDLDEEIRDRFLAKARENAARFSEDEKQARLREIDLAQEIYLDQNLREKLLLKKGG
jgi:hypothetical protein